MEDNGLYFSDDKKELKSCSRWFKGGCKIPSSVREIWGGAFSRCTGLTSVKVPSSVRKIGEKAFEGCTGLKSIEVSKSNPIYDSREDCNAIIETKTNTLIAGCSGTKIPSSVREIGKQAFFGCDGLKSIEIGSGVKEIGEMAFYGCTGLTSVEIPSSVREIGEMAFCRCTGLKSIEVSKSNPIYDSREGCNAIIETKTNTLIKGCSSTKIPSSVTEIGHSAFNFCTGLKSIKIPSSVTTIGDFAFEHCPELKSIEVNKSNPIYDSREDCNAIIETKTNTLIAGCSGTKIPSSVTKIGKFAFEGAGLTSIIIPSSIADLPEGTFFNCINLKELNIPHSIKTIGDVCMRRCSALKTLVIPEGVEKIGWRALDDCMSLEEISLPSTIKVLICSFDDLPHLKK